MIRVLQVVTHMNRGGLETMLMNYYRSIDREQIQFDFLTHRPYDGDYGEEIQLLGGIIYHLPLLNPFSRKYIESLRSFFQYHADYSIVHVHQDCMSSVILRIAKQEHIPIRIAHSHSTSQDKNIKYPIKLCFKKSIGRYSTELMACGKEAGEWMFGGEPFLILNNAIRTRDYCYDPMIRMRLRTEYNISDDTMVIGHVGRFSPPKNHSFLIDIFYEIKKRNSNSRLILVGDDTDGLAGMVKGKVKKLGLGDSVVFTGLRGDVAHLLQMMDVFVFPSTYEGIPMTMIEAQAAGLPCYISDCVPIECKLTDRVMQISLSDGAATWAEQIVDTNTEDRKSTYSEICAAGYDIEANARQLQEHYFSLVQNHMKRDGI